jgi:hypothetical protein
MLRVVAAVALVACLATPAFAAAPVEPRDRVAHHLQAAALLTKHFEDVLGTECPRFASMADWKKHFDAEVDRVVLLLAHLEQAWLEAKRTGDDDLRRTAKAPRQRSVQARALVEKLQICADQHGTGFTPMTLWWRIERAVPHRQAEIALPLPDSPPVR